MSYQPGATILPCIAYGCPERIEATCENPAPFCPIDGAFQSMVNAMDKARAARRYIDADEIRAALRGFGVKVEITRHQGTIWWRRH